MYSESITLYHITNTEDIPEIERAIKEDDEEAFERLGPYFKSHTGTVFLVNAADISTGACEYIEVLYELQGGIEVKGTEQELSDLTPLLTCQDCYACRVGDRFLIVLTGEGQCALVEMLKARVQTQEHQTEKRERRENLLSAIAVVLLWPYYCTLHLVEQERNIRKLPRLGVFFASVAQFTPPLLGFLIGTLVFQQPVHQDLFVFLCIFGYLLCGYGMRCGYEVPTLTPRPEEQENEEGSSSSRTTVDFQCFPVTLLIFGFLLAIVLQALTGHLS